MRHALENVIPSAAPLHVVLLAEGDRVAVGDGGVHRSFTLDGQVGLQSFRVATDSCQLFSLSWAMDLR